MKYLNEFGFTDEEIKKLYDQLDPIEWEEIAGSRSRVENIVEYLKSLGINNIKEIFFKSPLIFTYSLEEVKKLFEICNDDEIVFKINKDAENMEILY